MYTLHHSKEIAPTKHPMYIYHHQQPKETERAPVDGVGAVGGVVKGVGEAGARDEVGYEVEIEEVEAQAVDEEPDDGGDHEGGEERDGVGLAQGALFCWVFWGGGEGGRGWFGGVCVEGVCWGGGGLVGGMVGRLFKVFKGVCLPTDTHTYL